jgi:transcriptional regulator with XRE-family HTH domain
MVRGRKNPLYFGFAARLKRERTRAGHSRRQLTAKTAVLDGNMVQALEQGPRIPRIDSVEKIAYALGLSPGFLAYGLNGEGAPVDSLRGAGVGGRLQAVRLSQQLSMRGLARAAAITEATVRATESGQTIPTIATVEALAKALDISPAWLAYGIGPQVLPSRRRSAPAAQPS